MTNCLICFGKIDSIFTWASLWGLEKEKCICTECEKKFQLITGPTCPTCSRPQENTDQCNDCKKWEEDEEYCGVLNKNVSIYEYNDYMKEVLAKFKFRGDVVLANAFRDAFQQAFQSAFEKEDTILVPIPLGKKRLYERGFNQTFVLTELLKNVTVQSILTKEESNKQSKKTRRERLQTENSFQIAKSTTLDPTKHYILIDDIYTTGTTIRMAAKRLKENGATKVSSFTLVRS